LGRSATGKKKSLDYEYNEATSRYCFITTTFDTKYTTFSIKLLLNPFSLSEHKAGSLQSI
jgi:hypothetical protein